MKPWMYTAQMIVLVILTIVFVNHLCSLVGVWYYVNAALSPFVAIGIGFIYGTLEAERTKLRDQLNENRD